MRIHLGIYCKLTLYLATLLLAPILRAYPADESQSFQSYYEKATAYLQQNNFDQAKTYFKQALSLKPNDLQAQFYLAYALIKQDKKEEACSYYNNILVAYPWCTQARYNMAHTLKNLGKMEQAATHYQTVIEQEPDNSFAHFGLAQCYLARGNFEKGWPLFEWRGNDIKQFNHDIAALKKCIEEKKDLSGKRILLRTEWGLGDTMQFIRFAKPLKERGATVIMQAYKELKQLFSLYPCLDQVITVGEAFPAHDTQIPLLSLPLILNVSFESLESDQPYLYADASLIKQWKTKLDPPKSYSSAQSGMLKIGICWQGTGDNNVSPSLNKNIPLNIFAPLAEHPKIHLYCLQKVNGLEEMTALPSTFKLHLFDDDFDQTHGRFMDTAAVMHHLDLVITVDTSIGHLAGALGVPVWLMLPHKTDWRWYLSKHHSTDQEEWEESLWYPSMRLFRQEEPGNWEGVMQNIVKNLQEIYLSKN